MLLFVYLFFASLGVVLEGLFEGEMDGGSKNSVWFERIADVCTSC